MGCSCQGGVEIMSIYSIKDLPEDVETVVLVVNPDVAYVPSRNFKSTRSNIIYKVRNHDSVIEIIADDLTKMINIKVGKHDLFKVSDKKIEEFIVEEKSKSSNKESQSTASSLQTAKAQPVVATESKALVDEEIYEESKLDDFTVIKGIGEATNTKLHNAGIRTFEDLINYAGVIDENPEFSFLIQQDWQKQARDFIE